MADAPARRRYVKEHVDADLQFVWEEAKISEQLQYDLGQHYQSVAKFAAMADTRQGFRDALKDDFGLRPDSAASRASIAALVMSWEASTRFTQEEFKLRAEAKIMGLSKPLAASDRVAMRTAVEASRGHRLSEREEPAAEYVASKLDELETDEPSASHLDQVISRADAQSLELQTNLDSSGRLRIFKSKPKGKLPQTTEELRAKLRLEAHAWLMIAAKLRNKPFLQNLEYRHWQKYMDYLLGERCFTMQVPSHSSGDMCSLNPPWTVILSCEYQMGKWAIQTSFREGRASASTLKECTENSELKELYFTSPVAMQFRAGSSSSEPLGSLPKVTTKGGRVRVRRRMAKAKRVARRGASLGCWPPGRSCYSGRQMPGKSALPSTLRRVAKTQSASASTSVVSKAA